jgi:hypothetical protein
MVEQWPRGSYMQNVLLGRSERRSKRRKRSYLLNKTTRRKSSGKGSDESSPGVLRSVCRVVQQRSVVLGLVYLMFGCLRDELPVSGEIFSRE